MLRNTSIMLSDNEATHTTFDELLKPVQSAIDKAESQRPTPDHKEKLTFRDFFRLISYYFISDTKSLNILFAYLNIGLLPAEFNFPQVGLSTIKDGFTRFSANIFKNIFTELLSSIDLKAIPELAALGTLYCVDGSLFPTLVSMAWAEYKTNCKAVRLHLCYELNRMIAVNIIVGSGKSSERDALRKMLIANVTFIADRGYMCFKLLHEILEKQSHFVFRVKSNLVYTLQKTLTVEIPTGLQYLFKEVSDQLIICKSDTYGHTYRLVCFTVLNETFFILTDRLELKTIDVITLYAYRWQIELLFRFIKRTMNGIHLINNSKNGVTIQFYMLLIIAILELHLKQQVLDQNKQDLNKPPSPSLGGADKPVPPDESKKISSPHQFFATIGEKLKHYWKIGIHWLSKLRKLLDVQFNEYVIQILNSG